MPNPISELEKQSKQYRAALLAHDRDTMRLLTQRYGLVWNNIRQRTDALTAAIVDARAAGEEVKVSWLYQRNRLQILKGQVEQEINTYARAAATQISGGQAVAVELAETHARGLVDAQMPTNYSVAAQWTRLPSESVNDLVGFLHDGAPLSNLLSQLGPEASKAIGDALIVGVATGQGPRQVARLVRNVSGMPLQRALTIARTEQLRSYRTASTRSFVANADVVGAQIRMEACDRRTCGVCFALHGKEYPVDAVFDGHPNCRGSFAPKTKSWKEILGDKGNDIQETTIPIEDGPSRFAKMTPEDQAYVLGPSKYNLFKNDQIQLSDLVTPTRSKVWGPGLRESNIAEALAKAGARGPIAYKPVKTIAEAEQWARANVAKDVDFSLADNVESLNIINRSMVDLQRNAPVKSMDPFGGKVTSGIQEIRIVEGYQSTAHVGQMPAIEISRADSRYLRDTITQEREHLGWLERNTEKYGYPPEVIQWQKRKIESIESGKYDSYREHSQGAFEHMSEGTIRHEWGHVWYSQHEIDVDAIKTPDWKERFGVTVRARDSWNECVAENFTLYSAGKIENLAPEIIAMLGRLTGWSR